MNWTLLVGTALVSVGMGCGFALAQAPVESPGRNVAGPIEPGPVLLDWVPAAMGELNSQAAVKSSFTLNRTLLGAFAGAVPDSEPEIRHAIGKLDGVSVHLLRFGAASIADEASVDAFREAYHLRGWKHLVTTSRTGDPVHNETTDVWLVVDGVNVRGGVVLVESPKSLTLVTLAGNLSRVDLLHLRGHFGIPRFEGDSLKDARDK
jgi:hypothetical protein